MSSRGMGLLIDLDCRNWDIMEQLDSNLDSFSHVYQLAK